MLWVLVFLLFPHYAIASDDISYAKSETLHCSDNVCHVMNTINLFLNPQQTTELNLMSKGKIFGKLELQIKQLYTNCSKSDVYYMRDYEIKTIPRARCAAAGMCSTQNCAKINPKGHHFELPDKVQKWPGINFCADSCTTFACGFCFHGHGCSFWRNYAIPLNNLVFKIFKCSFDAVGADLSVKISLNGNNSKKFDVLGLIPAVTKKSNTFAFTLANYNLPTNNNERFIMQLGSKNKFLHIDDDEKFAKTVKCATQQKALRFKNYDCNFESDYCSCIPVQNNVNCVYKKSPIKQAFNEHNLLPLEKMGKTYQYKKGHVQTIFNKFSSLQLNIDLMNIDIAVEYSSAGCNFTVTCGDICGNDIYEQLFVACRNLIGFR